MAETVGGSISSCSVPSEDDIVNVLKLSRSASDGVGTDLPIGDGRYPPVLVLFHPSMKQMATRLVKATTARVMKLNLHCLSRPYVSLCLSMDNRYKRERACNCDLSKFTNAITSTWVASRVASPS